MLQKKAERRFPAQESAPNQGNNDPSPSSTQLVRRLGMKDLGWFAHEEIMPSRVRKRLELGGGEVVHERIGSNGEKVVLQVRENEVSGIINVLGILCSQDPSVELAYLCHPLTQYITKTRREGSFCGYRNIQMLISYICRGKAPGHEKFGDGVPSILHLQDLIEDAWDQGINADGRIETGGIKGTRKHIGTPEAQALLLGLGIGCKAVTFKSNKDGPEAWELLFAFVKNHFSRCTASPASQKVHQTDRPPIYLQRPRHSLTIVGFEMHKNGKSDLLVFDPSLRPSVQMKRAAWASEDGNDVGAGWNNALKPYRRGNRQLKKYKNFETLAVTDYAGK